MHALTKVCPKCGRRYDSAAAFCQKDGLRLQVTHEEGDAYIGQTLLDQFKIEEKIGAGGMGSVYRARQMTLHRDVAIKILHAELADNADAVRRFKREARVCTALDHPNVVRVFLFGQLKDGSLYIVMEHLDGRSLLEVIQKEGALPVHRSLHIATQICDGVGEAHQQGVVHRDIKPENVVLVNRRRDPDFVKVLDFGIARVLWGDDVTVATQSGLVFGTARYISPEGAAGESTDARSDVYSLGVLTYQLLCGETPFDAASPVQMLMKHIHAEAPHLRGQSHGQHVPEPVADVVMRALSKNPEGRYDDAHAYADALRGAAESAGFEVHRRRAARPSIGPPSEPGVEVPASASGSLAKTPPMSEPPPRDPIQTSPTLEGAPNPFDDDNDISIAGLASPTPKLSKGARTIGMAFVIGALLVAGGFGVKTYLDQRPDPAPVVDAAALIASAQEALRRGDLDEPRATSVLGLTDEVLAAHPQDPEAGRLRRLARDQLVERARERAGAGERDEALALYRRAAAFVTEDAAIAAAIEALESPPVNPPTPGVRTRPQLVTAGEEITLVAVLEPGTEIGDRTSPRFVIQRARRQVGSAIEATRLEDGSYEATHTISRSGTYRLLFRIGSGTNRIEQSADLEVRRDPHQPVRVPSDPPPVTTQGSAWTPSVAPAWAPTVELPQVVDPAPPPPVQDPAPPPPWTGSVL
ncbi:MAG: serine/threonine protein kinase [Sandaracinaceae bacterium]|nr:serine/threonine protein kinase [Sandaracinaceae bacterium]